MCLLVYHLSINLYYKLILIFCPSSASLTHAEYLGVGQSSLVMTSSFNKSASYTGYTRSRAAVERGETRSFSTMTTLSKIYLYLTSQIALVMNIAYLILRIQDLFTVHQVAVCVCVFYIDLKSINQDNTALYRHTYNAVKLTTSTCINIYISQ